MESWTKSSPKNLENLKASDIKNTIKLADIANISHSRIIGRYFSSSFDDYIWGGSIM